MKRLTTPSRCWICSFLTILAGFHDFQESLSAPIFSGRRSLPPLRFFIGLLKKTQSFCLVVLSGASEEVVDLPYSVVESSGDDV